MGIWIYTHTIITTNIAPDLRKKAEVLGDMSV